jgi:hypothetical protein
VAVLAGKGFVMELGVIAICAGDPAFGLGYASGILGELLCSVAAFPGG